MLTALYARTPSGSRCCRSSRSWRLLEASKEERQNFEISPSGYGVHWPDVDEDLSARGLLRGTPAPRPGSRSDLKKEREEQAEKGWDAPRIKQLRRRLNLMQEEFAKKMGVRQATVSAWENTKQKPSPMACRLFELLHSG